MDWLSFEIFSPTECDEIVAELRRAPGDAAAVYGRDPSGSVDSRVRRSTRVLPPAGIGDFVRAALGGVRERLSAHFGVDLTSCEEPQFLRYQVGDYFVMHQDGNTPLIHDDSRNRRVSGIVFLSRPGTDGQAGDYAGGELVFQGDYRERYARITAPCVRGTLLAFRSEVSHEVTPLTAGERYTIVTWYR